MSNDKVLVVDDDPDLLASVNDTLLLAHKTPISARSFDELVALREYALDCSIALLDINLGPDKPSGLDVFDWLRRQGFKGEITFLTGYARAHPVVAHAQARGYAKILQKPLTAEELLQAVTRTH